jgi:hypothetical protein
MGGNSHYMWSNPGYLGREYVPEPGMPSSNRHRCQAYVSRMRYCVSIKSMRMSHAYAHESEICVCQEYTLESGI